MSGHSHTPGGPSGCLSLIILPLAALVFAVRAIAHVLGVH